MTLEERVRELENKVRELETSLSNVAVAVFHLKAKGREVKGRERLKDNYPEMTAKEIAEIS